MTVLLHVAGSTFELVDDDLDDTRDYIDATLADDARRARNGVGAEGWAAFQTTDGFVHIRLHAGIDIALTETTS